MSRPRTIKDFFKRPAFAQQDKLSPSIAPPKFSQPSSSPLSDPPSDLLSQLASSQQLSDPIEESRSNGGISSDFVGGVGHDHSLPVINESDVVVHRSSSLGGSFNSSQRVVKNGQEIVLDSDADSTSSLDSLDSPEDLLKKFLSHQPSSISTKNTETPFSKSTTSSQLRNQRNRDLPNFRAMSELKGKKYKFSMESLVTRHVDDDEIEMNVAKAKALLESHDKMITASNNGSETKDGAPNLREDVLMNALSSENQDQDLQRLLNAVKRTEAFGEEKSWSFFKENFVDDSDLKTPEFPRDCIDPTSREGFLMERSTREKAFHSGILDFALSKGRIPNEVLVWMFQSVPLEPRDELRYAYCRALKHVDGKRIESLLEPRNIDEAFINLGGDPPAIAAHDTICPKTSYDNVKLTHNWKFLLSVLDLLRNIAEHLHSTTRERTLYILFRLALDTTVSNNDLVVAALEATIDSLLQSISPEEFEQIIRSLGKSMFNEVKDVTFQNQLLRHILPTSPKIASFRCRLAMAFLSNDASLIESVCEETITLQRVINYLKDIRLDVQLHKARLDDDYNYTELKAVTSLLNIVIDTGRTTREFPNKEEERQFNANVDTLAEQVKRIFSAMEDSGASHLKRTEAKQSLEALRYRIIYSIRSKPRVKSVFGHVEPVNKLTKHFKKVPKTASVE